MSDNEHVTVQVHAAIENETFADDVILSIPEEQPLRRINQCPPHEFSQLVREWTADKETM